MDLKKEYNSLVELIKSFRKKNNLPFRNEDIAGVLGYTRSYFSTLLGKGSEVKAEHIKQLHLNFPDALDNQTDIRMSTVAGDAAIVDLAHSNLVLAEANKTLSEANKIIAESNAKLVSMLQPDHYKASSVQEETYMAFQKIVQHGVTSGLWSSADKGFEVLGRIISGDESEKRSTRKRAS